MAPLALGGGAGRTPRLSWVKGPAPPLGVSLTCGSKHHHQLLVCHASGSGGVVPRGLGAVRGTEWAKGHARRVGPKGRSVRER